MMLRWTRFVTWLSLLASVAWAEPFNVKGRVTARGQASVADAQVSLIAPPQIVTATTRTDINGNFSFVAVPSGNYVLRVIARGYTEAHVVLDATHSIAPVQVDLDIATPHQEITVTSERGSVQDSYTATRSVNVISAPELAIRARSVVAQSVQQEEGLHLQRTSPTIAGVFVRGLTGNRVNVYVDGVRYSTSAQRGGINTFFNMNQASNLEAIEIVRGASSAQYGSDSIGGTVQLIQISPTLSDEPQWSGRFSAIGTSGDASYGSNLVTMFGSRKFGALLDLDGFRANSVRAGQGLDTHSAFKRFFDLPSYLFIGSRLPGTAFTQYGGSFRGMWTPVTNLNITTSYSRSQQDGGKRYDQLLGGDGNLIADLRNLMSDFLYVRLDKFRLSALDRASITYSYNAQREERVNQGGNGNPTAAITHEPERLSVNGVQGYVGKYVVGNDLILGAEYYAESIKAPSFSIDPVTEAVTVRRGRVPDGATYSSGGVYLQDVYSPVRQVTLSGAVRYSTASYTARQSDSPLVNGSPLWPDDHFRANAWTYRAGLMYSPIESLLFFTNYSRGFRTPHITDLGTLGLTGSGFEVAAPDIAEMGATIGTSAARTAVSSGRPVVQVQPEASNSYEFGVRTRNRFFQSSFTGFINDISDSITKQALILPLGAVGLSLGGVPIIAQDPTGTVFVAASSTPVLVRTNWDDARIWGLENRTQVRMNNWTIGATFTYIHAADEITGAAPNFEGGTPAPDGYFSIRYDDRRGRWWMEPYIHAAARQERLSTLDLEDRRTGAVRSISSIQNFFRRGATVRGYVAPGPDGIFGNADDQLIATGETLGQIQDRVLGAATSAPLYTAVPGYAIFNLRGGLRVAERHSLVAELENIGDRDYRGISWGVDAPGRSFTLRYTVNF